METRSDLISELLTVIGRFRRTVRASAHNTGLDTSGLTESQAELLRLVGRQPGISVSSAATELQLAANSASTLVSTLTRRGLVVRTPDPDDRRVIRLQLTQAAQRIADASRAVRRAALAEVIGALDPQDALALAEGLRVLTNITDTLRERLS